MKQINKNITLSSFTALFCAMTCVFTLFFHLPSTAGGYVHIGDSIIYLAASILPLPYAIFAASVGGGLADFLGGYPVYIIPTMIVKGLLTLAFSNKDKTKILTKRNIAATIIAVFITVIGYGITGFILNYCLYGQTADVAVTVAISTIFGNIMQAVSSAAIYFCFAVALDKIKIKDKIRL